MADFNQNQTTSKPMSTRNRRASGDYGMTLTADPLPGSTRRPSLCVYYHDNKICMEVRTNQPADMQGREYGLIRAEMHPPLFMVFLEAMKKVIDEPGHENLNRLRLFRPDFRKTNNGEPVLDTQVAFGKGTDGVIYLSVISSNKERPAIKFPFALDKWSELWSHQKQPFDPAEFSKLYAQGYLALWSNLMSQAMHSYYAPKEFKKPGQPPSGNGNDMRTESKPATDTWAGVDDLPF